MPTLRAAVKREAAQKGLFDDDVYACNTIAPWVKDVAIAVANGNRALKHAGPPRPRMPPALGDGEEPSAAWRRKLQRAAEFYVANFVPWDGAQLPQLTESRLRKWIKDERTQAKLPQDDVASAVLKASKQYRMRNRHEWTDEQLVYLPLRLAGGGV